MLLESGAAASWNNHGRILEPDPEVFWLATCAGASGVCAEAGEGPVDVYVAGRDDRNRSLIGRVQLDVSGEAPRVIAVDQEPLLHVGRRGMFDENGVSYPCPVPSEDGLHLYYVGWMPTVLTPFQNHVGLARQQADGSFRRVSRAPILPRIDEDPLCTGSAYVLREGPLWRMWYTAFLEWGEGEHDPVHRYLIKYAESDDGVNWRRDGVVALGFSGAVLSGLVYGLVAAA